MSTGSVGGGKRMGQVMSIVRDLVQSERPVVLLLCASKTEGARMTILVKERLQHQTPETAAACMAQFSCHATT